MAILEDWAPDSCTLPTPERPPRVAEFDDFFAAVLQSTRPPPTRLDLVVPRAAEATGRDPADRESECCSFFTFEFELAAHDVVMHISVRPSHVDVLAALQARAVS